MFNGFYIGLGAFAASELDKVFWGYQPKKTLSSLMVSVS